MRRAIAAIAAALVVWGAGAGSAAALDRRVEAAAKVALGKSAKSYAAHDYAQAATRLAHAVRACRSDACTTATRAALLRDLGAVKFRQGDVAAADAAWQSALKLVPELALNPAYDAADLRAAFDDVKSVVAGQPPEGDFVYSPPAEQRADRALPIHVEAHATVKVARVVVRYRSASAADWSRVELQRVGSGWDGYIPCADVARGVMRFWLQGLDDSGDPVANSGDSRHPFVVPVRDETRGEPLHLPDQPPPVACADCKAGLPGCPSEAASPSGDVVEEIDLSAPAAPATRAAPQAAPPPTIEPSQDTFRVRGFARLRVSAGALGEDVGADPPALRVPWNEPQGQAQLFAELRYAHGKVFEATVSGVVQYDGFWQKTYDPTTGAASWAFKGAFGPTLREAYVGTTQGPLSLRVGQQRIAWGNSDAFPVNDVLDPRDLRDPVLVETELRFLPVLAVRADYELTSALELELVGEPFFVPNEFDVYGPPWAIIQPTAPSYLRGLFARTSGLVSPALQAPFPVDDLSGATGAAKLAYTGSSFDAAVTYASLLSHQPSLAIAPIFAAQLVTTNWPQVTPAQEASFVSALQSGEFGATYPRTNHVGAWMADVVAPFVFRVDAAFEDATVLTQQDLLGVVRPTVQAVGAVELQSGEAGKTLLLEQYYERILGADPGPLLGANVNTMSTALVARWTFGEHVEAELRGIAGESPLGFIVRPQVAYKTSSWEARLGFAGIDGQDGSLPRYYRRNTSAYIMGLAHF